MAGFYRTLNAPAGTTGNNTHASMAAQPIADKLALMVVIEVIGGTPTLTWKLQGTLDDPTVTDANAQWVDVALLPTGSETVIFTDTKVALGAYVYHLAQAHTRFMRRFRVVASANTNVTYRAEIHQQMAR